MNIGLDNPWLLILLPLTLLPWRLPAARGLPFSSIASIPGDGLSSIVNMSLRTVATAAILLLLLGLSGLHLKEQSLARIGQGAHVVLLIDRSLSMGQPFADQALRNPVDSVFTSKGRIARALMSEFAARRTQDLFGLVVFSTHPIPVLPLTEKQGFVRAAIEAGNVGRGLSQTNLAGGIQQALSYFEGRPFTGSRIVLLVSDGAAKLDTGDRLRIRNLMLHHRVTLYWIYLRSHNSPGLEREAGSDSTLEQDLHGYFSTIGAPYRVFAAENSNDLNQAIGDVNDLQSLPIHYQEQIPRQDLTGTCFAAAGLLIMVLALAHLLEIRQWA